MKVTHEKPFLFQHVALESIMGQWEECRGWNTRLQCCSCPAALVYELGWVMWPLSLFLISAEQEPCRLILTKILHLP